MNKLHIKIFLLLIAAMAQRSYGGALVEDASKKLIPSSTPKFFSTIVEERQNRLIELKKERAALQAGDKEFNNTITHEIAQLKSQILAYEQALRVNPENEFFKQKLEASLERSQALTDLKDARSHVIAYIDELIKLYQEYLADPDLKKFAQSYLGKSTYSFDDLLNIHEKMLEQEKDIAALVEQEANAYAELQNRKRAAQAIIENYQARKEKRELESTIGLSAKQKADLETVRELAFNDRKAADAMRVTEAEYKYGIVQARSFLLKKQLDELRGILRTIKPLTKTSEADVALALDELDKKKQQSRPIKEVYRQDIEKLALEQRDKERELDTLSKRYNITQGLELDEWGKEPKRTSAGNLALAQVGVLNDEVLVTKRKKDLLEAQLALEDEKLRDEALRIDVKNSFFKTANSLFTTEDTVGSEIKKYQVQKDENKTNFAA